MAKNCYHDFHVLMSNKTGFFVGVEEPACQKKHLWIPSQVNWKFYSFDLLSNVIYFGFFRVHCILAGHSIPDSGAGALDFGVKILS